MVQPPQDPSGGSEQPLSQEDIDAALNEAGLSSPASVAQAPVAPPAQPSPAAKPQVDQAGRPFDQFAAAVADAISAETGSSGQSARAPADGTAAVDLPDFAGGNGKATTLELDKLQMLEDVQLQVRIELGRTRMLVQDVLRLDQGSVVELDKLAGDPVDIYVNERLVARGEVLVLNDNFCVRVNEIVSAPQESMA
jgi:flagellar motor switch protein FliN/FliY